MTEAERLRALADFIELHPWLHYSLGQPICYVLAKEDIIKAAKLPGAKKSDSNDDFYNVLVPVCEGESLMVYTERSKVCIAKRTETVTEPAKTYEKVVEWECHPLLKELEAH